MSDPARSAFGVLLVINLLNYLDRQILYALLPLIKAEFSLSDARLGALGSAFMLVYMCAAPPIGYWADRSSRTRWIASGVALWSLATLLSGRAANYAQLFLARAAVGIGESCYGSVSPSFIAEYCPPERRARVLAMFSMAIPVGSALGYILGGLVGRQLGWRNAFFIAGLPGLLLAALALRLRDPRTGSSLPNDPPPSLGEYLSLKDNPRYVSCTLAMAAMTFGMGALAVWMPTFYNRVWGMDVGQSGTLFGAVTVLAGLLGSLAGGWLADRALKFTPNAYFLVSGIGLLAAVPLGFAAVLSRNFPAAVAALFAAETCGFLNMGPLNAVIVSSTEPRFRSMAFAANIFIIHALGDAVSPAVIGRISDAAGLSNALLVAVGFLGLSGALCFLGTRFSSHAA